QQKILRILQLDDPEKIIQPRRKTQSSCMCLACLERSCAGELGDETGGALGAGGGQRSEDLPGPSAFWGFVTAGDFACDHRRTQLAFGQVISGLKTVGV